MDKDIIHYPKTNPAELAEFKLKLFGWYHDSDSENNKAFVETCIKLSRKYTTYKKVQCDFKECFPTAKERKTKNPNTIVVFQKGEIIYSCSNPTDKVIECKLRNLYCGLKDEKFEKIEIEEGVRTGVSLPPLPGASQDSASPLRSRASMPSVSKTKSDATSKSSVATGSSIASSNKTGPGTTKTSKESLTTMSLRSKAATESSQSVSKRNRGSVQVNLDSHQPDLPPPLPPPRVGAKLLESSSTSGTSKKAASKTKSHGIGKSSTTKGSPRASSSKTPSLAKLKEFPTSHTATLLRSQPLPEQSPSSSNQSRNGKNEPSNSDAPRPEYPLQPLPRGSSGATLKGSPTSKKSKDKTK